MAITPPNLRRHSEWLLEHARELRKEAEAARLRSVNRRLEADEARERASRMRQTATGYIAKQTSEDV